MTIRLELPTELLIEAKVYQKNTIRINNDFEYWWAYILTGKTTVKQDTTIIEVENILHKVFKKATKYTSEVYLPKTIKEDTVTILPIGYDYESPLKINIPDSDTIKVKVIQKHGHGKGQGKINLPVEYQYKKLQLIFLDDDNGIDEILQVKAQPKKRTNGSYAVIPSKYVGRYCEVIYKNF